MARAFVDPARSPSTLARALWIPRLSAARNFAAQYVLLQRKQPSLADRGISKPGPGGGDASQPDLS